MKYELIKDAHIGVIIDPTPVLQDIKDTLKVSFILPEKGAYIALFRDETGHEHKAVIHDGEVNVPAALLKKEQLVGLTVCLTDGAELLHEWECHPLRVGSFLRMRQTMWQLTAGLTDDALYQRIAELEKAHAAVQTEFAAYKESNADLATAVSQSDKRLTAYTEAYNDIAQVITEYNRQVQAFSSRLDEMESLIHRIFEALEQ